MKKLFFLFALLFVTPAWGQQVVLPCSQTSTAPCAVASTTNPLPITVYDSGNHSGYVYTSNGSGSPATFQAGGGGGGTPGGTNGQIQYNNSGAFGGVTAVPVANGGTACTGKNCYYGMPHWQLALQNVFGGISSARICVVSDSTGFGLGSNGSTNATGQNYPPLSWPTQVANRFATDYGLKSSWQSFMGDSVSGAPSYGSNDSRIVMGSSWSQDTTKYSLGLSTFKATTSTNSLSFLPTVNVDTFEIYYIVDAGQGVLQADINGSGTTTYSTSGTQGVGKSVITGTLGSNTLHLKWSSGGQVNVIGVIAYDSTQPSIFVINAGAPSARMSQLSTTGAAYNPGVSTVYTTIGCDLTIVRAQINDSIDGVPLATFGGYVQTVISAALASGDVLISDENPMNPTIYSVTNATQLTYADKMRSLANTNSLNFMDTFTSWGSYATTNAAFYADAGVHPTAAGYSQISKSMAEAIVKIPDLSSSDYKYSNVILKSNTGLDNGDFSGFVGIGTAVVDSTYRVGIYGNQASALLNIQNANTGSYNNINFTGNSRIWTIGGANSTESNFNIPNDYFIYDATANAMRIVINSTGLTGIGTTNPLATLHVNGTVKTQGYTVSTLPAGSVGMRAYVTDQTTTCPLAGAALTGSGAITCPVFYNGSAWVGD
jgi:hypothetical protein